MAGTLALILFAKLVIPSLRKTLSSSRKPAIVETKKAEKVSGKGDATTNISLLPLLALWSIPGGVGIAGNAHVLVLAADVDATRTRTGPGGPAILVPRRILLLRLGRLDVQDLLLLVPDLPLEAHDVPPGVLVQPPDAELLVGLHPVEVGVDGLLCLVGAAALLLQAAEERLVLVLELVDGVVDIDAEAVLAGLDLAIEEADLGLCMMRRGSNGMRK